MTVDLPEQLRVRLARDVRQFSSGTVLFGGSPARLLRLSAAGAAHLARWRAGEPVGAGARSLARRLLDTGLAHPVVSADAGNAEAAVTLVIPVKDDAEGVRRVLGSVGALEHVVVDDGSCPPLPGATVRHPTARGPAAARNAGWRRATTELIAFLDADVTPDPDWLAAILPLFDDPAVAAVAPRVRAETGVAVTWSGRAIARYEERRSSLDLGTQEGVVRPLARIGYVPTAALVVRRAALAEVGGFDERLRFGEDVDLVWRLADAGYLVRYQPAATVRHRSRATVRAWLRQRFDYGTSAAPLAVRHPGRLAPAIVRPATVLAGVLALSGRPFAASAVAVASVAAGVRGLRRLGLPADAAVAVAVAGQWAGVRGVAGALRRTWWPLTLVTRAGRRALAPALLPCVAEAVAARAGVGWLMLRVADDVAYSAGVWTGCLRLRTLGPLVPRWAGRSGGR